jgi:hypothetical protein
MIVRFGSLADLRSRMRGVRFTPESGHSSERVGCPLSANSGHVRRACCGRGDPHPSAHRLGDGANGTNFTQAFARSIHGSLNVDASAGVFDHYHRKTLAACVLG